MVSWVRVMKDVDAAGRLADSLRLALEQQGLTLRHCPPGPGLLGATLRQQWDGTGLSVNISRQAARAGEQRVQVTAATDASAMPPALCSDTVP